MHIYGFRLAEQQIKILQSFLADNVVLKTFSLQEPIDQEHTLLVVSDMAALQEILNDPKMQNASVLLWNQLDEVLMANAWLAYCHSEWHYLKLALETAQKSTTTTVILGSSYAKYGISAQQLGKQCVNLGLDAQDIYYTCQLGKLVIKNNPNIQQVVLASGYYWFYSDISRANTPYTKGLITETYYPILKDAHHVCNLNELKLRSYIPDNLSFLDEEKTMNFYCRLIYQQQKGESAKLSKNFVYDAEKACWNINNRYIPATFDKAYPNEIPWKLLPPQEKDSFAVERCCDHNKLLRHIESYEENKKILNEFVLFCNNIGVEVYILCMPQTRDYLRHLLPEFQEHYFAALDAIEGAYQFLDFHETDIFEDQDYMDQDHLGPQGAEKVTAFLKELLVPSRDQRG